MVTGTVPEMSSTIQILNAEGERLAEFLAGLDAAGWEQDSACTAWKVGDVVAHLTQGSAGAMTALARARQGSSDPPEGARFLDPGERASESTADRAIDFRGGRDGAHLLDAYRQGIAQLSQATGQLQAEDWEKPSFHRRGVIPVHENVIRRVQETAIHGWDIRSAFDPAAELSDAAAALIVNVAYRWLNACFVPLAGGANARIRFQVSGAADLNEDVVLEGDSYRLEPASDAPADVTFRANASAYVLLIYGRLDISAGETPAQLEIDGPWKRLCCSPRVSGGIEEQQKGREVSSRPLF